MKGEGTSLKGVRHKIRLMKFSDSAFSSFSKDQGYSHMVFILKPRYDVAPGLMALESIEHSSKKELTNH